MCGISGFLASHPEALPSDVRTAAVRRLNAALVHRGPDAEGVWSQGPCTLGHRRLSIIDLSDEARQPLLNEDGTVAVVVNGEIYNFAALRDELLSRGHTFRSRSDSEVVVHLYEELGSACIARLDGMFALALWDVRTQTLLLARDRSGKKPLYYRRCAQGLAFASEVQALVRAFPDEPVTMDATAVDAYLTLQYVPAPRTAFENVWKLPPATLATVSPGQMPAPTPYWHRPRFEQSDRPMADLVGSLHQLLTAAVKSRMVADVPLGAFLSGGLDSSTVVALMAGLTDRPVRTFSIGFRADDPELAFARTVARRYRTEHHEQVVSPAMVDVVGQIVARHGEPFADSSAIPMHYLSRMTREHVTVALSGDASDEDFAGYKRYVPARLGHLHDRLPEPWAGALRAVLRTVGRAGVPVVTRYTEAITRGEAARYATLVGQFTPHEKSVLYGPGLRDVAGGAALARFQAALDGTVGMGGLARLLDLDFQTYLADDINAKVDIASMSHALEVRCPFLDTAVVEFAARLPQRAMVRLRGKYILRRMAAPLVPRAILARTKRGFALPLEHWLRNDLRAMVRDVLLDRTARQRGLFNPVAVENLVDRLDQDPTLADRVWTLLMLELWMRTFLDGQPSRPGDGVVLETT